MNAVRMTPNALHIAHNFALPPDIITDTIGVLAIKGSGKTYTALVLLEEMVKAGLPVVALDPVGVFWGLRSSADGKSAGLPVVVLGGRHGDAPLEPTAGKVIAEFVAAERAPCVLDLSGFGTKAEHLRFARDFIDRLYEVNRDPLHVMIDEADDLAPQKPFGEEARVLRAVEVLVRRGRARGLGCTLITQRAAVLNKNVLTQCSTLILGRTVSPQDRKAVEAWVDAHGTDEQKSALRERLPTLPTTEKFVWSPDRGIFHKVAIRARETFDSSATPKLGAKRAEPKALAEVDLAGLCARIASTIEKVKADDPRELRRQIAELKKAATTRVTSAPAAAPAPPRVVEVPMLSKDALATLAQSTAAAAAIADESARAQAALTRALDAFRAEIAQATKTADARRSAAASTPRPPPPVAARRQEHTPTVTDGGDPSLPEGEKRMLTVIAQHPGGVARAQLTTLLGYKKSYRDLLVQKLKAKAFVVEPSALVATEDGIAALGNFVPLPTGRDLFAVYMRELPDGERRVLELADNHYPDEITRDKITEITGYRKSYRDLLVQKLSGRKLITQPTRGALRMADELAQ